MTKVLQILIFSLLVLAPLSGNAAKQIKAFFDYKVYYLPGSGSFLETHINISAPSLKYEKYEGGIQSRVQITLILKKGETIVDFKKYEIASPIVKDSILEDLYDIQKFLVPPGQYEMEIELVDVHRNSTPISGFQAIEIIDYAAGGLSAISFIEFANKSEDKTDPFYKSGYQLIPYLSSYFSNDMDRMIIYFEGYNIDKKLDANEYYVLNIYIEDFTSNKIIGNHSKVKRKQASEVVANLDVFNIEDLPTGDYNIVVQIIDRNNDTIFKEVQYFERYKKTDEILDYVEIENLHQFKIPGDSIAYYVESLVPICGNAEQANIYALLKERDTLKLKKFMAFFWNKTDALEPLRSWEKYKHQVDIVEVYYGTQIKRGFQADRGRVYLQYGPPNTMIERPNEPSAYPYEIWQYNKLKKQSGRQFIFYNRDLVTNEYTLLHSDAIGELQNYRWQHDLMQRNSPSSNIDDPADGVLQHWGGNSRTLYNINE